MLEKNATLSLHRTERKAMPVYLLPHRISLHNRVQCCRNMLTLQCADGNETTVSSEVNLKR